MASRTQKPKLTKVEAGSYMYGCTRIRRVELHGYRHNGIRVKGRRGMRVLESAYLPKIIYWAISFKGKRVDSALTFRRAKQMAALFIDRKKK